MDLKILTPTQVWANYNPVKAPLEASVVYSEEREGRLYQELYITAEEFSDGKLRAFVRMVFPKGGGPLPAVLFVPSTMTVQVSEKFIDEIVDQGFVFVTFDYGGRHDGKERFTLYPPSIKYCENRSDTGDELCALDDIFKTPWYVWMKIARRVITYLCSDARIDSESIGLVGVKEGAQLAWKVGGIDGRLGAVIPIVGCGLSVHREPKFSNQPVSEIGNALMPYLAGMSSQAYAKTITCPLYYLTTTNSVYADVDRLGDILALVPSDNKSVCITAQAADSISEDNFESMLAYLVEVLKNKHNVIDKPELRTYVSEGKLYATVTAGADVAKVDIYTAYDELVPEVRSWDEGRSCLRINGTDFLLDIDVPSGTKRVFLYSNITYKSGIVLSTEIICIIPSTLGVTEFLPEKYSKTRIIFSSTGASSAFNVENDLLTFDANKLTLKAGAYGIKGISSSEGWLTSYKIGSPVFRGEDGYLLQLELYIENAVDISFKMFTYDEASGFKEYSCVRHFNASKHWQRSKFEIADFKDKARLGLKSWKDVKKFEITGAVGVLINNVLWL